MFELMELSIRDDLLGPALGPNEIVRDTSVRARYLVEALVIPEDGLIVILVLNKMTIPKFLSLLNSMYLGRVRKCDRKSSPEDDALDEVDTSNNIAVPRFGITFCVAPDVGVTVSTRWGKYERVQSDDRNVNIRRDKNWGKKGGKGEGLATHAERWRVDYSLVDDPMKPVILINWSRERLQGTFVRTIKVTGS